MRSQQLQMRRLTGGRQRRPTFSRRIVKKEEVKVEVEEGRVLQISGERSVEKEDKNDKWHSVERGRSKFSWRFWLPENAKIDQVKASMENGVLTVSVPEMEEKKAQVKSIEITG